MKVVLDEMLPAAIAGLLAGHDIATAKVSKVVDLQVDCGVAGPSRTADMPARRIRAGEVLSAAVCADREVA